MLVEHACIVNIIFMSCVNYTAYDCQKRETVTYNLPPPPCSLSLSSPLLSQLNYIPHLACRHAPSQLHLDPLLSRGADLIMTGDPLRLVRAELPLHPNVPFPLPPLSLTATLHTSTEEAHRKSTTMVSACSLTDTCNKGF